MNFVDTHCHIQFDDYKLEPDDVIAAAQSDGVDKLLIVGCSLEDSLKGVEFVGSRNGCWASIGLHPHEADRYATHPELLERFAQVVEKPKVVAIGECGLDFYYNNSEKSTQILVLEYQLTLAQKHGLPVIFHVREAFDDFWPIFDNFPGLTGVIHSFTADTAELERVLQRGLYVGLNGIMTFTKDSAQLEMARQVPLDSLVLETDAPFLTPAPFRGTICEPKHVRVTAEFLADLKSCELSVLAAATTHNATKLFSL